MYLLDLKGKQFKDIDLLDFDKKYRLHNLDMTTPFWKKYLPEAKKIKKETEAEK